MPLTQHQQFLTKTACILPPSFTKRRRAAFGHFETESCGRIDTHPYFFKVQGRNVQCMVHLQIQKHSSGALCRQRYRRLPFKTTGNRIYGMLWNWHSKYANFSGLRLSLWSTKPPENSLWKTVGDSQPLQVNLKTGLAGCCGRGYTETSWTCFNRSLNASRNLHSSVQAAKNVLPHFWVQWFRFAWISPVLSLVSAVHWTQSRSLKMREKVKVCLNKYDSKFIPQITPKLSRKIPNLY